MLNCNFLVAARPPGQARLCVSSKISLATENKFKKNVAHGAHSVILSLADGEKPKP